MDIYKRDRGLSKCFLIISLFIYLLSFIPAVSSGQDSCVKCHTDENILKTLYKPVKIESSEGEG